MLHFSDTAGTVDLLISTFHFFQMSQAMAGFALLLRILSSVAFQKRLGAFVLCFAHSIQDLATLVFIYLWTCLSASMVLHIMVGDQDERLSSALRVFYTVTQAAATETFGELSLELIEIIDVTGDMHGTFRKVPMYMVMLALPMLLQFCLLGFIVGIIVDGLNAQQAQYKNTPTLAQDLGRGFWAVCKSCGIVPSMTDRLSVNELLKVFRKVTKANLVKQVSRRSFGWEPEDRLKRYITVDKMPMNLNDIRRFLYMVIQPDGKKVTPMKRVATFKDITEKKTKAIEPLLSRRGMLENEHMWMLFDHVVLRGERLLQPYYERRVCFLTQISVSPCVNAYPNGSAMSKVCS